MANGQSPFGRSSASLVAVALSVAAIGARVGFESGNAMAGGGAALAFVLFLGVVVVVLRHRASAQVDKIEETGVLEFDAGLDFSCLPGDWPLKARETLNPAGAANTPFLPVRLSIADQSLRVSKKRSWGSGRQPFEAAVDLAGVTGVEVQPPELAPLGSTLLISVRGHPPLRAHLQLGSEDANRLADLVRQRIPVSPASPTARDQGLVVESSPPSLRTSFAGAWLLLMATLVPFIVAMVGAQEGPAAAVGTLCVLCYALWLQLRRPPTMNRRLAVALSLASVAFVVDATSTREPWRLIGTIVCLGLAAWMSRIRPPS